MQQIPALDTQTETYNTLDHPSVVHGYRMARGMNLDPITLAELSLCRSEVPAIMESLRKHGIKKVAVTQATSGLMGLMWGFAQAGATFEMDLIDTGREECYHSSRVVPGLVITVN